MTKKRPSQLEQVKELLRTQGDFGLTQMDAIWMVHPSCLRLAPIIFRLRRQGWKIDTVDIPKTTTSGSYAKYILRGEPNND